MKKVFLGIIAAIMAAVMCVSFTGCAKAKNVKGEKVTEEQWVAAIESLLAEHAVFTVDYSSKASGTYTHKTMVHKTKWSVKETEKLTLVKNGALESVKGSQKLTLKGDKAAAEQETGKAKKKEIEKYSEIVDSRIYNFEKGRDDEWTKEESFYSVIQDSFSSVVSSVKSRYSSFVYSNEHNGYISKNYDEDDSEVTVYKFKDAKLIAVYIYEEETLIEDNAQDYAEGSYKTEVNITIKYTAKKITLPKVQEKEQS